MWDPAPSSLDYGMAFIALVVNLMGVMTPFAVHVLESFMGSIPPLPLSVNSLAS